MAEFDSYAMHSDIEASFILTGDAQRVLRDIRNLKDEKLLRRILIRVRTKPSRRFTMDDQYQLPLIAHGDGKTAREALQQIAHQARISAALEQSVLQVIGEAETRTK